MTKFIKNFLMLAVIAGAMVLTGCIKKDAATINVKVVNKLTMPQANVLSFPKFSRQFLT